MQTGLERIFDHHMEWLRGKRVGLIVNPASVDMCWQHAADLFARRTEFQLTALFGPQHGIRGETQDNMIEWEGWPKDSRLGVPVYSLYGKTRKPTPEMLRDVDVLVFDVPDVGTRVYTFIYTMALGMQAAREKGIPFVVLDRPNPINGRDMEGPILNPAFASFVGMYPIPMRHGMTVGELARFFNEACGIGCELLVAPLAGWTRATWIDKTWLPWVMPSPNMPTLETATVYPGMVMFEGTQVSEGRGTTRPFEIIGAPYINPYRLADHLNGLQLPGVHFRPTFFQPTFHKFVGQICGGVQVHILNRASLRSFQIAVEILKAIHAFHPDDFQWKQPPYEYVEDKLPFDVIVGNDVLRRQIEENLPWEEISATWQDDMEAFIETRRDYLLYE
ncbi:MAG: DUF1343 domain-containing protein [Blastocatellia bacterium]|nr:DUF1343 domain-containing protein [Blastocatellia bacterium]